MDLYVEVNNISKSFGERCVLKELSFSVCEGESVSVMGENGSGKSTLIRMLAGQLEPDGGSITIGGRKASEFKRSVYLPQNYRLVPHRTLIGNMLIPLQLRGFTKFEAAAIALEQLKLFGIEQFKEYYPCQLSGGILRRAAIAETGLFDADIMLLDEPMTGVDTAHRGQIYRYLNSKRLDGVTLFLVTHSLTEAEYLTERTIFLGNGGFDTTAADKNRLAV